MGQPRRQRSIEALEAGPRERITSTTNYREQRTQPPVAADLFDEVDELARRHQVDLR